MRISGRQKRNSGTQISIPTASPVHLAQTGSCFPFQKKDLSGLQWHPNTIGIHLSIKPKNLSSKESNSNSNAAYKYPIQNRASNRNKCSDSSCFCIFWLIVFPYQEKKSGQQLEYNIQECPIMQYVWRTLKSRLSEILHNVDKLRLYHQFPARNSYKT